MRFFENMSRKIDITKKQLIDYYFDSQLSTILIAKLFNCSKITILRKMRKFGIPRRTNSSSKKLIKKREGIHYNFKGGLPKCIDCGKQLSKYGAIRCVSCKGKFFSLEKQPMYGIRRLGKESPDYIDGRYPLGCLIRKMLEYRNWRKKVFERDNYTCQKCNKRGNGYLEAHHKKPFAIILSEFLKEYDQFSPIEDKETLIRLAIKYRPFWDTNNGKTLCKGCHELTDTYFGKYGRKLLWK